jgi:uncharacterized membrane protein YfcA
MLTYLIAAVITFIFTTVLTIAGVGAAFILIPIFLMRKIGINKKAATTPAMVNTFVNLKVRTAAIRNVLLWLFVIFLIFAGSIMLFYEAKAKEEKYDTKKLIGYGVAVGGVAGYLGGLLGVGGGNFIVPVLVWLGFNPKKASATTAFVVIFSSLSGFLGHATTGNMNIWLLLLCAAGSISGALLGSYLMRKKMSRKQVKMAIGIILYIIALKMIWDLLKPLLT